MHVTCILILVRQHHIFNMILTLMFNPKTYCIKLPSSVKELEIRSVKTKQRVTNRHQTIHCKMLAQQSKNATIFSLYVFDFDFTGEQIRWADILEDLNCRRHWMQEFCLPKKLLSGGKWKGGVAEFGGWTGLEAHNANSDCKVNNCLKQAT